MKALVLSTSYILLSVIEYRGTDLFPSQIKNLYNLIIEYLYACSLIILVTRSKENTSIGVKVQYNSELCRLIILNRLSGNPGIIYANIVSFISF